MSIQGCKIATATNFMSCTIQSESFWQQGQGSMDEKISIGFCYWGGGDIVNIEL